ncbi:MAG: hypothetical protein IJW00_00415 [Clostridia bacterium]|nr:hypothetical protein [Clostridia bacterium]
MIKWIKKLFWEPPADKTEIEIKALFQFLIDDYGFTYAKNDLGNLVDKNGKLIFYGPLLAYQLYNENLCINIVNLVQRADYDIYITEKCNNDQHYIFSGLRLPSHLAYRRQEFANEIKSELLNSRTIWGKNI